MPELDLWYVSSVSSITAGVCPALVGTDSAGPWRRAEEHLQRRQLPVTRLTGLAIDRPVPADPIACDEP